MEKFRFCHINGGLMMRQHQVHEIKIVVARWFSGPHGRVHCLHTLHQLCPVWILHRRIAHGRMVNLVLHRERASRNDEYNKQ